MAEADENAPSPIGQHLEETIASVGDALSSLRYGSILLVVHEGRVVQIDVTEKKRLGTN